MRTATPAPAHEQYAACKVQMLTSLDAMIFSGPYTEQETGLGAAMAYNLAETATMFGEEDPGDDAAALNTTLKHWRPNPRIDPIRGLAAAIRQTAFRNA